MKKVILILITSFISTLLYAQDWEKTVLKGDMNNLDHHLLNQHVIDLINQYRKEKGLTQLSADSIFTQHCKDWGQYLIDKNQFRHADKFPAGWAGECILGGSFHLFVFKYEVFAFYTIESWKNSPRHWAIIMQRDITKIGIYTSIGEPDFRDQRDATTVLLVGN